MMKAEKKTEKRRYNFLQKATLFAEPQKTFTDAVSDK